MSETAAPPGRPPRHLYQLTSGGIELAQQLGPATTRSADARPRPVTGGAW
jgi:hypothetical protein